jgi:hypothetical protein
VKKEYRIPYIPRGLCNTTPVIPKYNSGFYFTLGIFVYFCIGKFFHLSLFIAMIKKYLVFSVLLISALFISPTSSHAQFTNGKMLLGPHIGLAAYGGSPAFGANFEVGVTEPGKVGPGIIGVSGRLDYWSYGFDAYDKFTWITIGVFGNYHFSLDDKRWDLFAGLGLGYQNVSWSYNGVGSGIATYGSGIFFAGDAGARYFFSPAIAARAMVGFGLEWLVIGVDFALN